MADSFQKADGRKARYIPDVGWQLEGRRDMGLGREMVNLVGGDSGDEPRGVASDVEGVKNDAVADRGDAPVIREGCWPNCTVYNVPMIQEMFTKITSVLPADSGNEGSLWQAVSSFIRAALNPEQDTDGQLLPLFALATAIRGKTFVELGVRHPRSTLPLLWAACLNHGHLWSVDQVDPQWTAPAELASSWTFTKTDALSFLADWPKDKRIDLVFVDDWHAYPHVRRELELLDPLVSPGSLILLHDTMWAHHEPFYHVDLAIRDGQWESGGPARAMMELDQMRWEWATLPWWHGLSVVRKKHSKIYFTR